MVINDIPTALVSVPPKLSPPHHVTSLYMQQRLPRSSTLLTETCLRHNTMVDDSTILANVITDGTQCTTHQGDDGLLAGYHIISSLLG